VKLNQLRVGGEYAVRLDYRRLVVDGVPMSYIPFAAGGYRATVVGYEKSEAGRTLVRVELTGRVPRWKDAREANPDGTWTVWQGYVVDDQERPVEDDWTSELVVQSSQVICEWTDAVVQQSVGSLDADWQSFEI
jgi:hypothetical protein